MGPPSEPEPESESGEPVGPPRERRRDPRVTVPWPAFVEDEDGRVATGEVIDVSLSGMKLRVGAQMAVGGRVTVRVSLPRGGGDIEISAQVVRRDPEGIGVAFGALSRAQRERFRPLLPTWDLRRRAERVGVEIPVQVEGHDLATEGHTADLSIVGGRVTTVAPLTAGSRVVVRLAPKDGSGPMSIQAVVWEADTRGAVLVFANVAAADFARLRSLVDSLRARRP